MRVSYRQTKRLWKRYRKEGAAGLVHGSAGRISNRAKPKKPDVALPGSSK
jgi:hypothetical protein